MATKTKVYQNVDQIVFNRIRLSLASQGVNLPNQPVGSTVAQGYRIDWSFNEAKSQLSVTLEGGWMLMGMAWSKVDSLVAPCLA